MPNFGKSSILITYLGNGDTLWQLATIPILSKFSNFLWILRLKTQQPILPYSKVQSHILGTSERAFWRTLFDTFLSKTVTHTYLEHIQNLWWLFISCNSLFVFCGLKWGSGCWWQISSSNGITSNSTVVFLRIQPVF